jgi:hypothetical protein
MDKGAVVAKIMKVLSDWNVTKFAIDVSDDKLSLQIEATKKPDAPTAQA